jgi:hypothetical protein
MLILCPVITSIISYITAVYLLNNVPNICTSKNLAWRCLNVENSYSLTVVWGIIGKKNQVVIFFSITSNCNIS